MVKMNPALCRVPAVCLMIYTVYLYAVIFFSQYYLYIFLKGRKLRQIFETFECLNVETCWNAF